MTDAGGPSRVRRVAGFCWRWTKRAVTVFGLLLLLYAAIVLIGLIPVNNDFAESDGGIEILLISSAVHADLVLPAVNEQRNWRAEFATEHFSADVRGATHVAIGWGDAGFYIHTPTWSDLRASTAANALLLPSQSCMHVGFTYDEYVRPKAQSVMISPEQYAKLLTFIDASFEKDDANEEVFIPGAYGTHDAFFEANGNYHALNTCNSWIGRAMRTAGIRVPMLTPLPKTAFLYLPE